MKVGASGATVRARRGPAVCGWLGLCLAAGCALGQPHLDRALQADPEAGARQEGVAECYTVHYPDVLEVRVAGRPTLSGRRPVGLDGRLDLGGGGPLRVEGRTAPDIARLVAGAAGVPPAQVQVRVAEFNSQLIYLSGQGVGLQRTVPYEGPETVLDLLRRTGGLVPGAAPDDVYVIRPHLAEDRQPEVFHIKLHDILVKKDAHTNLRLEPFDQVNIGETRPSSLEKCVPPCLRPVYAALWGLRQPQAEPAR
jgi:polysaccharide export outer membrane protein